MKQLNRTFLIVFVLAFAVFIAGCTEQKTIEKKETIEKIVEKEKTPEPPLQQIPPPPIEQKPPELKIVWTKDPGVRTAEGSVPYIYQLSDGSYRLYFCGR